MCLPFKPYAIEREWNHAGLLCVVVQGREGQFRCGYVRIPPSHPMHGKNYNDVPVDVHGGLTFGDPEPCKEHEDGQGYWFGFDCAHLGDASVDPDLDPKMVSPVLRNFIEIDRLFGDGSEHFWTTEEAVVECERLAEQLAALA